MPPKRCRTCRTEEMEQPFREISAFYAQVLLDFQIKVPRINACSSICGDCEDFLAQYESFKKMCEDSNEYFEKLEKPFLKKKKEKRKEVEEEVEEVFETEEEIQQTVPKRRKTKTDESSTVILEIVDKPETVFEDNEDEVDFMNIETLEEEGGDFENDPIDTEIDDPDNLENMCNWCHKKFASADHLKRHIERIHLGEAPNRNYRCEKCNLDFPNSHTLKEHRERIHNLAPGHVECEFCDACFLKVHLMAHIKENHENQCKYCRQKFPTNGTLRIHMNTHADLKTFPCYICEQKFFTERSLQSHLNWHSKPKEKKWVCEDCGFEALRNESLLKHKRLKHAEPEEEKFICGSCKKECRSKKHYESHILKHIYGPRQDPEDNSIEKEVEVEVFDDDSDLPDFIEVVKTPVLKAPVVKVYMD